MDEEFGEIVHSFQKNASELLGAGLSTYKNKAYFFIRVFVPSLDDPEALLATKKGINLPVELLPEVSDALKKIPDIMARNKVVKVIPRGDSKQVRIGINDFKGHIYIDIRTYQRVESDGTENKNDNYVPTQKGISVSLQKYEELMHMMKTLQAAVG